MSGFDQVGDTFAGRSTPTGTTDDDPRKRGVELKHTQQISNEMPVEWKCRVRYIMQQT